MAEKDYTSMLNLTYELEGLLVLLGQRDDERNDSIRRLAIEKVDRLRRMIVGETRQASRQDDPELGEIEQMAVAPEVPPVREEKASPAPSPAPAVPAPPQESIIPERPLMFTLNDKFRFRRELFANNDIEFNDTLNILAGMSDLTEAEDYLYNDLCWDPTDENVQAFIALLADHFPS